MSNKIGDSKIRKRADGRFEWRYTTGRDPKTGKLKRRSVYGTTYVECYTKKMAIIAELEVHGKTLDPSKMTVEQWLNEWLQVYCGNLADSTRHKYERDAANRIIPYLGKAKLCDLSTEDVQKWINEISAELSPKTVTNINGTLHHALQKAVDLSKIRSNPAERVELPRKVKTEVRSLPETSVKSFAAALEGDFYKSPILFALYTGLRINEILGLSWSDVDFRRGVIHVRNQLYRNKATGDVVLNPPKHNKTRVVPLTKQAVKLLKEQREQQAAWKENSFGVWDNRFDLVFTNEIGGVLVEQSVRKHCKTAFEEIGMPELRFHDLRHTYAVFMIRAGVDFKTISENMGHTTVTVTMDKYAHVTREMEQESAYRLGAFMDQLDI